MDLAEILAPLSVASCSLDKRIVIYSLKEGGFILRTIEGDHSKGIKRLSYSPIFGGYLISVGYEVFANVWSPESLVSQALIGKLKGH